MTTNVEARLASLSAPALCAFRVVFGLLFAMHGTQKLFDWPVASPMPVTVGSWPAWWAGVIELVAGLLIALGLFTRIAAFIAAGHMAVAYFWMHFPSGFWPLENNGEPAVLFCFAFLLLAAIGAGAWSIDARRGRGARGLRGRLRN